MNEKPTNNIDDIFRNSIGNMETEPSEHFWLKASEDALFKSNLNNKRTVNRWKAIAAVLAIGLVSLSAYMFYLQKQVSNLNSKVNELTVNNSSNHTAGNVQPANVSATPVTVQQHNLPVTPVNAPAVTQQAKITTAISGTEDSPTPSTYSNVVKTQKHKTQFSNTTLAVVQTQPVPLVNSQTESHPADNLQKDGAQLGIQSQGGVSITGINSSNDVSIPQLNTNTDISNVSEPVSGPIVDYVPPQKGSSKFSVSLFYEPYVSDELFENDAADNVNINNVTSSEEEVNPFKIGARAEYNFTTHFSVITGVYYYNYNVSVQPSTIFAQKQNNGDVGYSFSTSAGTVVCPYGNSNPTIGDAMVINGTYKTSYVTIPVMAKYAFTIGKWNIYAAGGIEINTVAYRKMDLHWQDVNWQNSGDAIEGIASANKVYFAYYVAPGVSYSFQNGFSLYAEPSLQGSPVLFSESGEKKSSSPYTGVAFGITYKF